MHCPRTPQHGEATQRYIVQVLPRFSNASLCLSSFFLMPIDDMVDLGIYALVFVPIALAHPLEDEQARPQSLFSLIARSTHAFSFLTSTATTTPTSPAWALELKRQATANLKTCGYISGDPDYPVTCDLSYRCVTWKAYSVAGCCDTQTVATDCVIPTTCVPYNAYKSCTSCVEDSLATTCSSSALRFCSENHYLYGGLTLTEYSCGITPTTKTVFPFSGIPTSSPSTTASGMPTLQPTSEPTSSKGIPTDFNIGAAIGGAIGSFVVLALLTFWAWSRIRNKKLKAATILLSGSSAAQPASMTETQNVATTAVTPMVLHTGQRVQVST